MTDTLTELFLGIPPGIESRFNGKLDGVSDFNCALQYENEVSFDF